MADVADYNCDTVYSLVFTVILCNFFLLLFDILFYEIDIE